MLKVLVTGSTLKIGMAAVCNLAKNGCTVVGADEKSLPFNMHSRHLESLYRHAPFNSTRFYEDILSIIRKEKPDVLIPIGGTGQISLHKNEISKLINVLVPDYESYCTAFNKKKTYELCCKAGIDMPKHFTGAEANYLLSNRKNNKLVIKPDFDIGGSRGFKIVNSPEELEIAGKYIQDKLGNYIIEEFIPGASRTRTLQLLFNKQNKLISYFILKKIRQWPVTGGNTAYAVSTHEQELLEFVLPFFEKCRWEGPAGVQLIIDERNGKPKLIEINPRFTGSLPFAVQSGVGLPFTACLAAMNKDNINVYSYEAGKFYIHLSFYLKAVIKEFGISGKKFGLLKQVFKELLQRKVGVMIDKKDLHLYLVKALTELKP
jgi:predicted ATP-grasp superfamily ATP-dependent carboligase